MFFAGMALGIVAGAAFGIGIMCCVVAGKQEDQQMEQIRVHRQKKGERKTENNPFPGSGRDREVLPFGWGMSLHDGRGRNQADRALPLCGWEAGGCEWPGLGYWGISPSDGMQKNPGVSAGRE